MRINIFETALDGHRARYVREMILGIKSHSPDSDLRVCLMEHHRKSSAYIECIKPLEPLFRFCGLGMHRLEGTFRSEITRLRLLRSCVKNDPCDRLIVPFGDGLVPLMGMLPRLCMDQILPRGVQIESMLFRSDWVYPVAGRGIGWYQRLRRFAVCRWPGWRIHLSDHNAYRRACTKVDTYSARVSLVPEVLDSWVPKSKESSIECLVQNGILNRFQESLVRTGMVLSAPGSPSLRKGSVELIQAFTMKRDLTGTLLIWGELPRDVQRALRKKRVDWGSDPRVIVLDRFVSGEAFCALFSLSDAIVLPYQFRLGGVSSIFLLSAVHRKKTLCDKRAWMGWASEHYRHALAIDSTSLRQLQDGFDRLQSDAEIPIAPETTSEILRAECMSGSFGLSWGLD